MNWVSLLISLPILLVSLTFHEAAHGFSAFLLGDDTAKRQGRLTLNPMKNVDPIGSSLLVFTLLASQGSFGFGWAKPVPVDARGFRSPRHGMALVALAGPGANLVMACVGAGLLWITRPYSYELAYGCYVVFVINVILAALNMLPIPPLDGSKVLGGLLPESLARSWAGLDRYANMTMMIVVVGLWTGALSGYLDWPLKVFSRVLLPPAWWYG